MIKDSGERTQFESGAVRDMHEGKGRFDLLPMCVLMRLAKHYENGSKKYGDRNWEKGIPAHSYVDSAFRHLVKYMDGWTDEDHLISAIWNLCGLAWTEEKRPDLIDIPSRTGIKHHMARPVYQYSKDGTFIKKWDYMNEAAKTLKLSKGSISNVCLGRAKTSGGFVWSYKDRSGQS